MIGIIVQARTRSDQYPRKIFEDIGGKTVLQRTLDGVCSSRMAHKIILAVPEEDRKEITQQVRAGKYSTHVSHRGFSIYCGASEDLLDRFYNAAGINGLDVIVRVKGDCPFIQGDLIDDMLFKYMNTGHNGYMASALPNGLRAEIFSWHILVDAWINNKYRSNILNHEENEDKCISRHDPYLDERYKNIKHSLVLNTHNDVDFLTRLAEKYDSTKDLVKALVSE